MDAAGTVELVPVLADSALALSRTRLATGSLSIHEPERDSLLYVVAGSGSLGLDGGSAELVDGDAALVLAGEHATIAAGPEGLTLLHGRVDEVADRHAPLGPREIVVGREGSSSSRATGARSFRVLLGPHNGSTRATLFVGYVPPGRAPWHYHLYDEIVWIPEGPARILRRETEETLAPGSAIRFRPREAHVVENPSGDRDLVLVGIFTPAGSPSAAYLAPTQDG